MQIFKTNPGESPGKIQSILYSKFFNPPKPNMSLTYLYNWFLENKSL